MKTLLAAMALLNVSCVALDTSATFSFADENGNSVGVTFKKLAPQASDKNPISAKNPL